MTQEEQQEAFEESLDKLVAYYAKEYKITYASLIGCLMIKIAELTKLLSDKQK